jgi:RNA polymerase sigma-70 factor (ECF subfamily)
MSGHRNVAFDAAVLPLLDDVFDFARHLTGEHAAAEELAQAAFARAFEAFHRFRAGTSARAWLFTIVRNLYFNDQRGRRRHPTISLEEVGDLGAALEEPASDQTLELDQAIALLPVKLREVVVLDLQGLTCREIAGVVTCPAGTVMSRLHRARQVLRGLLEVPARSRGVHP